MSKDENSFLPNRSVLIRIRVVIGVLLCAIIGSVLLLTGSSPFQLFTATAPPVSENFAFQQKIAESAMIHCEIHSPDSLQCFDAQKELDRLSAMAHTSAEYAISDLLKKKQYESMMSALAPHIIVHEPGWEPSNSSR